MMSVAVMMAMKTTMMTVVLLSMTMAVMRVFTQKNMSTFDDGDAGDGGGLQYDEDDDYDRD